MLLALIPVSRIKKGNLNWIASNKSPFKEIDPVDLDEKLIKQVYSIYRTVYSQINNVLYLKDKYALLKYDRWVIIIDESGRVEAFALYSGRAHGAKLGITASIILNGKVPVIKAEKAAFIIGPQKKISISKDRIHYTRKISGIGMKKKMMVGNIVIK